MSAPPIEDPVFTLSCGPVEVYPAVLRALSKPVLYHYDPAFLAFYEKVNEKAKAALRLSNAPVILQGEPVLGLEAAAASLIARDDVVLNLASGVYGKLFAFWAARYAREVIELEVPFNEAIDPAAVEAAFKARPDIRIVSVVHHDTPSATINPLAEIGRIVAAHGAYMLVDAVSSFGGMDVHPESSHSDLFVTGPNKCLGGSPGLTLLGVSERAWAKMEANPDAPRASILSILDWKEAWRSDRGYPFTPSVSEIYGLDAALDLYFAEGPERVWARHGLTAQAFRAGIVAMGLGLWAASEAVASPTATAVRIPDGIDDGELRRTIRGRYGVMISAGMRETAGKLVRLGHMGPTARPLHAVIGLTALGGAFRAIGHKVDIGAGTEAAMAVIDAAM